MAKRYLVYLLTSRGGFSPQIDYLNFKKVDKSIDREYKRIELKDEDPSDLDTLVKLYPPPDPPPLE